MAFRGNNVRAPELILTTFHRGFRLHSQTKETPFVTTLQNQVRSSRTLLSMALG